MHRVRIGVAGCGLFGESHLRAWCVIPGAEITAVYDPVPERAFITTITFEPPLAG